MANKTISSILGCLALSASLSATAADDLCAALDEFTESVGPEETREIRFHTIVGANFKDREAPAYGARRCDFGSHEAARPVCEYLMKFGSIESPGYAAKKVIGCISPKTRFAPGSWIHAISFATNVGREPRIRRVEVVLAENPEIGGMTMAIKIQKKRG